jgi:Fic family protein
MRTYEKTHPWIKFKLDLRQASYNVWLLLGEAQSKCEHIAGVPLRPVVAEKLHSVYLAKGALATTAIEGNTLSEEEVLNRIEGKLKLPPSKEYLGQEIDNIVEACNLIGSNLFEGGSVELCVKDIKTYNSLVLKKLPLEEHIVPGEIRTYPVGVGRYRAAPPEDCGHLLEKLCDWLNANFIPPKHEYTIAFGILKAIVSHLYLAWIHPFGDGNGRTARLVEFHTLIGCGVPSTAAHLLSNHYNETRREYYRQLDYSSQSNGDVMSFIEYALQGFVDGLKEQLTVIRNQQWDVTWRNFVHEKFKDKNSEADVRRRHLALDLSRKDNPVPMSELKELTPRVAGAYAQKTHKTLIRDVHELRSMGLIEQTPAGIRAKKDVILAFLPSRRDKIVISDNDRKA